MLKQKDMPQVSIKDVAGMVTRAETMKCNVHALVSAYHKIYMLGKKGGDPEQGLLDFLLEVAR
jgi:hypothetical protein